MSNTTYTDTALEWREADESEDVAGHLSGIAVPYGPIIRAGGIREQFASAAFDPSQVEGKPLCWRHGEPIGRITRAENTPDGLVIDADIAATSLGRDAATLLRTGSVTGLSVGFSPVKDKWNSAKTTVTRQAARLHEVSLTHMPAYQDALVGAVRENPNPEGNDMSDATEAVTETVAPDYALREDLNAVRDQIATLTVREQAPAPVEPMEFLRQFGETVLKRAWTDVTVDGTASDNSPVPADVSARINLGRPTFAAIGASPLAATGMDAQWMLDSVDPTVGPQTAEKTEIPSGPASGAIVSAPVVTIAGGNDVSLQFAQRASGWDMADYMQRLGEIYARNTNAAVIAELEVISSNTGTIPTSLDTGALGATLGKAASDIVSNTGWAPNVVLCDSETFFRFGAVAGNGYPLAGGNVGNADLASLQFNAFGLRFVCDPQLDGGAAQAYVLNTRAIGIKESAGAPFSISANVPSKLGIDYAVYGYLAVKALREKGVTALTKQS